MTEKVLCNSLCKYKDIQCHNGIVEFCLINSRAYLKSQFLLFTHDVENALPSNPKKGLEPA